MKISYCGVTVSVCEMVNVVLESFKFCAEWDYVVWRDVEWSYVVQNLCCIRIVSLKIQNLAAERSYNNLDITLKEALKHRAPVSINILRVVVYNIYYVCPVCVAEDV